MNWSLAEVLEVVDGEVRVHELHVRGLPQAQGSVRAFKNRAGKVFVATEANRTSSALGAWRTAIAAEARLIYGTTEAPRGPIAVGVALEWPRPAGHFGKRGLLASAPRHKTTKPDVDKAIRAVLDALTGIAFVDDSQVVRLAVEKRFSESPGALIRIEVLE